MRRLKINHKGFLLYKAGLPHFPRNFTRDSIISAILMKDSKALKHQLSFCASKQGNEKNAYTGEEPGKIFHEFPGVEIHGKSTEFSACDTTALYLIGHEVYQKLTEDKKLATKQSKQIEKACEYIISHLKKDLFAEDPKLSGAKDFALKVTYWKDSEILRRKNGKPRYPVVYTLAHIQNMRGLKSGAKILSSKRLKEQAEKMVTALQKLYYPKLKSYCIAIDAHGPIHGASSDLLHSLFYLDPSDISDEQLNGIVNSSKELETKIGYRTLSPKMAGKVGDQYHANTVWPFEQAMIYEGARKFGLTDIQKICLRIISHLDTAPEKFTIGKEIKKSGCDPQFWTIAAKKYFEAPKKEFLI
ncbi:MAG: hypothetical protein ABIH79_03175 [archaeon]